MDERAIEKMQRDVCPIGVGNVNGEGRGPRCSRLAAARLARREKFLQFVPGVYQRG